MSQVSERILFVSLLDDFLYFKCINIFMNMMIKLFFILLNMPFNVLCCFNEFTSYFFQWVYCLLRNSFIKILDIINTIGGNITEQGGRYVLNELSMKCFFAIGLLLGSCVTYKCYQSYHKFGLRSLKQHD